ncbi:hypothetical protein PVK06_046621 [Gossypium arboreum]|uniref:Hydroxyproline-rich glycoprotein family protein n=1 Tax=Gossypium arboreum TaxID=29729 RepID=A0ABR0MBD9_GOSAR|nr:hypothetical protein PVK06_046621 [Gossypium arboreum]
MAYNHFPSLLLPTLLVALLSFNADESLGAEARSLQETTTLPKLEFPPFPGIPTLPKPDLPVPKLPELPEIPGLPKPELPTIPTLPKDLPFPFFSPPHATTNP